MASPKYIMIIGITTHCTDIKKKEKHCKIRFHTFKNEATADEIIINKK
jgi:hypothetical protein